MQTSRARLGIYNDGPLLLVHTDDGPRIAPDPADFPFFTFACEVGSYFGSTLLFGRGRDADGSLGGPLLPPGIELAELPAYDSLLRIDRVARGIPGTLKGFWRGLSELDMVWVFGPHPFAFLLVGLALLRRRRVVLGVRQDTVAYFRSRLPTSRWRPALLAVHLGNIGFRGLARILKTTVVGSELSQQYGGENHRLLAMTVSLVRSTDVVASPRRRDWSGRLDLLTVGRIDQEKNPFLLVDAIAALERSRPGRYRLVWVGTGPLRDAVAERARRLGVSDRIELVGFLPFGPELLERYREADVFVHVSLTEGVPAVLIEALASGTPIVATAVGGVAAALEHGGAGLLVPPSDLGALVSALQLIGDDCELHDRLVERGLKLASGATLDAQAALVARFINA